MKKYIILLVVFISLLGCRVAKKEWVKENYTEKSTTREIRVVQDSVIKSELFKIKTSVSKLETSVSKSTTTNGSTSENESTTVSGTITAEDGKEKSVTIGGTIIKSDGANVTFETTSSKAISKEFQENLQEISKELQEKSVQLQEVQTELISLKSEFSNFKLTYESEKTIKTNTVKKTGFQFGVWIIAGIVVIVILAVWYFRKSISFLS